MIALVRHAKAGDRGSSDDHLRALTQAGRRQADGLINQLEKLKLAHILSSPYTRCRETVEPLAAARGLRVETSDLLAEGAAEAGAMDMMARLAGNGAALCSHGDVIVGLLLLLAEMKVIDQADVRAAKGSTWLIEFRGSDPRRASYLAPPGSNS